MTPNRMLLFLAAALAGWTAVLAPAPAAAVEQLRAVQITTMAATTYQEAGEEFKALRRAGYDTVILRVFQQVGDRTYPFAQIKYQSGVYFQTEEAPVVADVLTPLVPLARAAGLRVFAWMSTLSTPLQSHYDLRGRRYDLAWNQVVPTDRLDPFHPEVRRRLLVLFRDLARYDLNGILVQDDLVLRHTEGFSPAAAARYRLAKGQKLNPDDFYRDRTRSADGKVLVGSYSPAFWEWARWKNRELLELAGELQAAAHRENPDLRFALNLTYEVLTNPQGGLAWLSQDFSESQRAGFDYLSVMAYHRQMARELDLDQDGTLALIATMVSKAVAETVDPASLLFKIQVVPFIEDTPVSPEERSRVEAAILAAGPVSLAVFPYRGPDSLPALVAIDIGVGSETNQDGRMGEAHVTVDQGPPPPSPEPADAPRDETVSPRR